jgi:hypothetical protein
MQLSLLIFCSAISGIYEEESAYRYAIHISPVLQQIVSESGGSFQELEPAMQAIVQAAATAVVTSPHIPAGSCLVSGLLPVVPLLTAEGYSTLLDDLLTGGWVTLVNTTCVISLLMLQILRCNTFE